MEKAPFDKTYAGIISDILFTPDTKTDNIMFGQYKICYGNSEKRIKLSDGLVHEVGELIIVHIFENSPDRVDIDPTVKRIVPYKIAVENKGTAQEEVTKMTVPDGSEIEFEGWDI